MMNIAMKNPQSINKSQVALRFAQAGQSYSEHAIVQRKIAQQLFDLIGQYSPKQLNQVFEMGCGSGNLSHLLIENLQIEHLILNDLYSEVQQHFQLDQAVQIQQMIEFLIGDIEQLNFPQNNDLIASSSVLQWMGDLDAVFAKARHSLNSQALL
jgi:malonyl-CoA O-methyltransferase